MEFNGSDDYRRHLGVPAIVRQDLERLSLLIQQQTGERTAGQHPIDRVVLYIDDLDRCPTPLVIKVLEAVHLLLAFPLFVVVVAVDSLWLESSLKAHYRQLRAQGAVPADYLEKIFQVPFWVQPLDPTARRHLVRGLLTPSAPAGGPASGAAGGSSAVTALPGVDDVLDSLDRTELPERRWGDPADMTVTPTELDQLGELADLTGTTPRSLKRFVNVYLLVKSMGRSHGWDVPEQGQLALLLALSTRLPVVAAGMTTTMAGATAGLDLGAVVSALPEHPQRATFQAWLVEHPGWVGVDLAGLARWTEIIPRFTFARAAPATSGTFVA